MILVSAYFDENTNKELLRHIEGVAKASGNTFMLDNNVPPHLTLLSIETKDADAVVGVRYGSSQVMQGAAEVVAYGTAVKLIG